MNDNLFSPGNTNAIAGTTSSLTRPLPGAGGGEVAGGPTVVFYNDGPGTAFVITGANALGLLAVAPTLSTNAGLPGSTPLPVGQSIPFSLGPGDAYWAVVSLSTSNVYCTRGDGR